MKPITNILLILALVCYVFLPFCSVALAGSMTGLSYSAELITENFSLLRTLMGLLPFVALFGAVAFNCTRSRHWGLVTGLFIIAGLYFFIASSGDLLNMLPMNHDPEVAPTDFHEGYEMQGKAIGYYLAYGLTWAALLSCIISMMPFEWNLKLERQIDDTLERQYKRGKEHLSKMEHELHHPSKKAPAKPAKGVAAKAQSTPDATQPAMGAAAQPAPSRRAENPLDYLPADQRPASPVPPQPDATQPDAPQPPAFTEDKEDPTRFMPH